MKKLLSTRGLILFSVFLVVLYAEIGVRLLNWAPPVQPTSFFWRSPDPVTGWSLQPNASGRWFNHAYEYDTQIQINERGLRSPDAVGYERDQNTLRILVLGDSYVEALQVPLEETFPQRLTRLLQANADARDDGRTIEVINAGVSGWGTDQQLLWLRQEGANYRPDAVLLAVHPGTDFMNNSLPLEFANEGSIRKPFFDLQNNGLTLLNYPFIPETTSEITSTLTLAKVSDSNTEQSDPVSTTSVPVATRVRSWMRRNVAIYRLLVPRVSTPVPPANLGPDYIPIPYGIYEQPLSDEWKTSVAVTGMLFEEIKERSAEMDATFFATVVTSAEQVYPERWETNLQNYPAMQAREWSLKQPNEFATALLSVAEIPTLDLLPIFRERADDNPPLHLRNDGHWTAAGHLLAADALAEFLIEEGLLADEGKQE